MLQQLQQLQPESTLDVSFLSLEVVIDVGSCKQRAEYDDLGRSEEGFRFVLLGY